MKKLKTLFIVLVFFAMNVSATNFDPIYPIKATAELRAEIIDLIGKRCPYEYDKNECKAIVLFKLNSNNEIEVLNVISKNIKAEPYLTKKLNHKQVNKPPYDVDQIFILPIKIIKRS